MATMISYLLNALSTAASTASGTPGNAEESRRGGDVSPRCVTDVEDKMGLDDGAAGGPTPSRNDGIISTTSNCREVKTNSKTAGGAAKKSGKTDESEENLSLDVMAATPDEKQPTTAVMTEADDGRMDTDSKIVADIGTSSVITVQTKAGKEFIENGGEKKRKRGGAGSHVSSSVTSTAATTGIVNKRNHRVQNHDSEPSILPKTTALSTQLQMHAALMSTRSAIRRAYTHSHLGGIILISSSNGTVNNNAGIVTGRNNVKRGNDDIGGNCILAIRYCGFKDDRAETIEVEYARTSTLERAERFLGCCAGSVNNCGGGGDFAVSPPQWEKYMLPSRIMSSYLGLLDNSCAYQGYSCMESGVKVYEGVLP